MRKYLLFAFLWTTIAAGMYLGLVASPPDELLGDSYRLFFFHLPFAILAFFSFTITAGSGIMYLRTGDLRWDAAGISSVRLGFIFGGLALMTGWAFSYLAWGTRWSWDPKVIATMVMWFIYMGYLFLRKNVDEETRRARLCAVYGITGYASVPLSYLSSRITYSLHPGTISFPPEIRLAIVIMSAGFFLLFIYLFRFNMKIEIIERKLCQ